MLARHTHCFGCKRAEVNIRDNVAYLIEPSNRTAIHQIDNDLDLHMFDSKRDPPGPYPGELRIIHFSCITIMAFGGHDNLYCISRLRFSGKLVELIRTSISHFKSPPKSHFNRFMVLLLQVTYHDRKKYVC